MDITKLSSRFMVKHKIYEIKAINMKLGDFETIYGGMDRNNT